TVEGRAPFAGRLDHEFHQKPDLQEPRVVDAEQAARAGRDLETIIDFSQLIGKDAERLDEYSTKQRDCGVFNRTSGRLLPPLRK
ncbi:MAG: hypothetical protein LC776_19165, partial [Acidobacteria bacterium]|nr:hypothetical protein [Acidobacteriota bacterium]